MSVLGVIILAFLTLEVFAVASASLDQKKHFISFFEALLINQIVPIGGTVFIILIALVSC